jgi:Family of unknown function (DUF6064)
LVSWQLFSTYNPDVWPLPIVAYALGIGCLAVIALRPSRRTDRLVAGLLALAWLWLGAVFQGIYARELSPLLGTAYAVIFVVEAGLIARAGVIGSDIAFRPGRNIATIAGILAIGYALVVYPLLGVMFGHGYPEAPLFGAAPCPTTIVTFGLFLFARPPFPTHVLAIPMAWAILGPLGAVPQGATEDVGLFIVGVVALALILVRDRVRRPASRLTGSASA